MSSLSAAVRGALLGLVTLGLAAGCAHGGATGEREANRPNASTEPEVTADDMQRNPDRPIEQILMSRVPGLWVTRTPDGGVALRIRGATSVHGSNQPLFVIDGTPVNPGPGGGLTGINPYDIESIAVLTDAADTAMYGVRGANGVIVIRTKRPGS